MLGARDKYIQETKKILKDRHKKNVEFRRFSPNFHFPFRNWAFHNTV